ncbi:MAG: hypothetical protein ACXWQO_06205 [Bdellovibrionota bacterium]
MKASLLYTALLLLAGCATSTTTTQPELPNIAETQAPEPNRHPASWTHNSFTQPDFSREDLLRSQVLCKNIDKLSGVRSGIMKAETKFTFGPQGYPTDVFVTVELRARGIVKKSMNCSSGTAPAASDTVEVYCSEGEPGVGLQIKLTRDLSVYAKQKKLGFYRGTVMIPQHLLDAKSLSSESLEVVCIARNDGPVTPKDENYLINLRHNFGKYEQEEDWIEEPADPDAVPAL